MENSVKVSSDLDNFNKIIEKYQNNIHNLSSVWQGPSYDNLINLCDSFVSEKTGIIEKQMNAFAKACDAYHNYETTKGNLNSANEYYQQATTESEKKARNSEIEQFTKQLEEYKREINTNLEIASGEKIEKTSFNENNSTSSIINNSTSITQTNEKMQNVADVAVQKSGKGYNNMCEEWAEKAWEKGTGIKRELQPDAYTAWKKYGVSTDKNNIPKGAMVYASGWPTEGGNNNPYGHVAIYIGDGKVADQGGVQDLDEWASKQKANCHGHQGYIGWGWQNGIDLTKV